VPIWLTAHRTQAVIVSAAQLWRPRLCQEVLRLTLAAGCSVVLVADHDRLTTLAETARGFQPSQVHVKDLHHMFPPSASSAADGDTQNWTDTAVPDVDWPIFRAESRRILPPDAFASIDRHYLRALRMTSEALREEPDRTEGATRSLLVRLLAETSHHAEATAALRAAQAAHFRAGYNLRIDVAEALAQVAKSRSIEFTPRDWRALRAYREPGRAAACVLYGAQMPVDQIQAATLANADEALRAGRLNGTAIPEDGLAILRAARLERTLEGARSEDRFIVCSPVANMLTNAAKDLGLVVASTANRRSQHTAGFWQYRLGFIVKEVR
jgi:hypothetical protein